MLRVANFSGSCIFEDPGAHYLLMWGIGIFVVYGPFNISPDLFCDECIY